MSSTVAFRPVRGVRGVGTTSIIAGVVLVVAGIVVAILVATQLSAEKITVSDDAAMFAGQTVRDPFTAYAQAEVINDHALEASGGKTYAELGQDDPVRQVVMTASFLRASLFTSVVSFGMSALVIGLGLLFVLIGGALRRLAVATQAPPGM
ncbi:aromatic ring-opening dioxygenase LigA [Antribacter sp. KLBMP9083]|uniref:Aromatic ring-opening dioxygenase LigA n=1 Tax=Antribacter soli TaxID=2910976 RepID=A0AA41UAH6_9MICO|nr:aromatic ring-opening dioxygenase LigA [Antribacter soli]MCF4122687.1 aromatic ring-opening dioxygenase LigA [Antribacter soli]